MSQRILHMRLPGELVDEILRQACLVPGDMPQRYAELASGSGVADAARTTTLMCVSRWHHGVLAPLLYSAPLLLYPSQLGQFERALAMRPSLAPLVKHLFIGGSAMVRHPELRDAFVPDDYESLFGIAPPDTALPLHHAIEYDIAELGSMMVGYHGVSTSHIGLDAYGRVIGYDEWSTRVGDVCALVEWARRLAALQTHTPAHPRADAARLDAEHARAVDDAVAAESNRGIGVAHIRARLQGIAARPGTRRDPPDWDSAAAPHALPRDLDAGLTALGAQQLDALEHMDESLPRWLRLAAARAIAYGRIVPHAQGTDDPVAPLFSVADAFTDTPAAVGAHGVLPGAGALAWAPRGGALRDAPPTHFLRLPFDVAPAAWYSVVHGPASPLPPAIDELVATVRNVLAKTASLQTLALHGMVARAVTERGAPIPPMYVCADRQTLILGPPATASSLEMSSLRDLGSVRRLALGGQSVTLRDAYAMTRPGEPFAGVERMSWMHLDGIARADRAMLDRLGVVLLDPRRRVAPAQRHEHAISDDPMDWLLAHVAALSPAQNVALDNVAARAPSVAELAWSMAYLEWLSAAHV